LPPLYVAVWVVLSSMALTFLGMQWIRPDLAESLSQSVAAAVGSEGRAGSNHSSDERARAEIIELRRSLDALSGELNAVRHQLIAREERDQALAARLAGIEARQMIERSQPLSTASIDRVPAEAPPQPRASAPPVEPQQVQAPAAVPEPRERPRDERIAAAPEPAQSPPQAKAPPEPAGPRGIQIATGPSVDALRISWMLLAQRHGAILQRYEPRFVQSTSGSGPAYRLIAGPIDSTASANKVCSELRARRVTCGVSAFGGEPL
jgi:hypothetical protein